MNSLPFGKRITFGFTAIVGINLILGLVALFHFHAIDDRAEFMAAKPLPGTIAILSISSAVKDNFGLVQMHFNSREKEKITAAIEKNKGEIDQLIQEYELALTEPADRTMFAAFKETRTAFVTEFKAVLALNTSGKTAEAIAANDSRLRPAYQNLIATLDPLVAFNLKNLHNGVAGVQSSAQTGKTSSLVVLLGGILAAIGIAFAIIRSSNRILGGITETLDTSSDQTAGAAGQVSSSSQSLAEGASEQAASIEETSASLEEMSSMTKRNADSAQQAKQIASIARTAADTGAERMQAMQTAMQAITTASADISNILKTIDEIAFQTNILALNAAVEAARAGEAGAGFAVVADEGRALAQRSAAAAKETAAKIEDSVAKSQQGAQISAEVAKSFDEIQKGIRQLDSLVAEIATASSEQSSGIALVTTTVSQMDKVTQSNASNAEETAASAQELSSQALTLKDAVAQLQQFVGGAARASRDQTPIRPVVPSAPQHEPAPTPAPTHKFTPKQAQVPMHTTPKPSAVPPSPPVRKTSLQMTAKADENSDFFEDT